MTPAPSSGLQVTPSLVGGAGTRCDHGCTPVVADRSMDMPGDDLGYLRMSLDYGTQALRSFQTDGVKEP